MTKDIFGCHNGGVEANYCIQCSGILLNILNALDSSPKTKNDQAPNVSSVRVEKP
jgi:hypothetical protein